jgi:hypothetical protein
VAHLQAHTPLNRILKSPQCLRRRESPTGRSVPTSTKVLVTSHFLFSILRDSPTNKIVNTKKFNNPTKPNFSRQG